MQVFYYTKLGCIDIGEEYTYLLIQISYGYNVSSDDIQIVEILMYNSEDGVKPVENCGPIYNPWLENWIKNNLTMGELKLNALDSLASQEPT